MRGIVFAALTCIVGGLIALGLDWLAALLPDQMAGALRHVYGIGVAPLSLQVSICGMIGLVLGYLIISKFVRK